MPDSPAAKTAAPRGVLLGGLAAGALDIVYAMINAILHARSPVRSVQAVASGLLGKEAFDGGATTFLLGLGFHFFIACGAALTYYVASRRIAMLRTRVWLSGAIFGICVYLFMNFVVLPLSVVPFKLSYPPAALIQGFVSHTLLVGIPIALAIRWADRRDDRRASETGSR